MLQSERGMVCSSALTPPPSHFGPQARCQTRAWGSAFRKAEVSRELSWHFSVFLKGPASRRVGIVAAVLVLALQLAGSAFNQTAWQSRHSRSRTLIAITTQHRILQHGEVNRVRIASPLVGRFARNGLCGSSSKRRAWPRHRPSICRR